ncbi:hypothetical protein PCYB_008170 [Plasmodium cynomolgi strain B]|uniref:CYIR protein n=1 Tax=Plasmodium cynomolgi (strain B) TaxID=1120755 RepID=K6UP42_PLACD|nr:hypothetical protein PCYB_008170 [Plasmodium cynomolgi strain B]GAB70068.1 hypothetical protein PCYB_008170 [Plasmodium cynomolgi strain B]
MFSISHDNDLADNNDVCMYLNYVIHKEISEFNNSDYKTKEFYDNLINKFEEESFQLRKYCKKYIQHLDKKIYEKMGKLYELYSIIDKFKITYPQSKNCEEIDKCVSLFKNYTRDCNDFINSAFCKALLNFHIYTYTYLSKEKLCTGEILPFTLELKGYTDEDRSFDESDFGTEISQNSVFIAFSVTLVVNNYFI